MDAYFTRQELYDLVWSEPAKNVAVKLKISDYSLTKACEKANIPKSGYENKINAGKTVLKSILPTRGFGVIDRIW